MNASSWEEVSDKRKKSIDKALTSIAKKVNRNYGKERVGLKTRLLFYIMRHVQKKGYNKTDTNYWRDKGWLDKDRSWKQR